MRRGSSASDSHAARQTEYAGQLSAWNRREYDSRGPLRSWMKPAMSYASASNGNPTLVGGSSRHSPNRIEEIRRKHLEGAAAHAAGEAAASQPIEARKEDKFNGSRYPLQRFPEESALSAREQFFLESVAEQERHKERKRKEVCPTVMSRCSEPQLCYTCATPVQHQCNAETHPHPHPHLRSYFTFTFQEFLMVQGQDRFSKLDAQIR